KSHKDESRPGVNGRFELFINKHERQRFAEQLRDCQHGDDEAMSMVVTARGLGIYRVIMLSMDAQNIKDVLMFPAMKPPDQLPYGKQISFFPIM
ncbi:hypothetical protein ZWY2020_031719, partial [Hordeum vulgare]